MSTLEIKNLHVTVEADGGSKEILRGVDLTIERGNGETLEVEDVAVRTMNPGDEDYGEDGELSGHEPDAQ